jgi:hypothetical protein
MSNFTPTGGSIGGSITADYQGATNPSITWVDMVLANTEYTYSIPSLARILRVRGAGLVGAAKLKLAFVSGESGTKYITVWPGSVWDSPQLEAGTVSSLYIQSTKAGERIEIEAWE